jgi:hypothetical protein
MGKVVPNFKKENARDSPHNVLLVFSQAYIKHYLRKNKIVMAFTIGFFRY